MTRRIVAFLLAIALMVVFGSAAHSYFVQRAWSLAAGQAGGTAAVAIPFADRISWAAHDLGGMLQSYGLLTSTALLIALLVAGTLARFTGLRVIVFGVAGAIAMFTLFKVLRITLGTVGAFGARGVTGLAAQMAVGAVACVLFAQLTQPRAPR
jgi:hypothetical protein